MNGHFGQLQQALSDAASREYGAHGGGGEYRAHGGGGEYGAHGGGGEYGAHGGGGEYGAHVGSGEYRAHVGSGEYRAHEGSGEYRAHGGSGGPLAQGSLAPAVQVGEEIEPRRGARRSLRGWPGLAVAVAMLAITATAAAAIVVLDNRSSAPLTGTVPSLRALRYDVPLTPDLEAGHAGWCSDPRFSISSVRSPYAGGGSCAPSYLPGTPILLAAGEPISNAQDILKSSHTSVTARQGHTNLFWAIVTARVADIRLSPGQVVVARHDDRLPSGWKAVVAFVSGQHDPVALDGAGHVIREPPSGALPTTERAATRTLKAGAPAPRSPCSIRAPRLPKVTASWGVIALRVPTLGASVTANVLFSCARSWYSIKGYTEAASAAILLGARDPRRAAPAPPGLAPTAKSGVFAEDGGADGLILATRVGRAWLLVQGPSTAVDAMLIAALRAEGPAVGADRPASR